MAPLPRALRGEIATIQRDFIHPSSEGAIAYPRDETLLYEGGYGWDRWDVYSRIILDCHAGAVLQKRWRSLVGREWKIEPGGTSRNDKKAAEMVEAQLRAMATRNPEKPNDEVIIASASAFDEGVLALLSAHLYGLSVCENIWESDGQEIYIDSLFPKDIRRFEMVAGVGGWRLRLRAIDEPDIGMPLDPRKFTVHRHCIIPTEDPWGYGVGAQLFYPVFFKKNCTKFWLIFADKHGNPTSIAKVPVNTSKERREEILAMLGAIASDSGIVLNSDVSLDFIEAASRGAGNTHEALIQFCNDEISKAVLGETGTTDQSSGGGSRARDEVANEIRVEISKGDADLLASTLNRTLIRYITRLNFPPNTAVPAIAWQFPELEAKFDRSAESQIVVALAGAEYRATREWVAERFEIELEEPKEEDGGQLAQLFGAGGDAPTGELPPTEQPPEEEAPAEIPEEVPAEEPPAEFAEEEAIDFKAGGKGVRCGGGWISKDKQCQIDRPKLKERPVPKSKGKASLKKMSEQETADLILAVSKFGEASGIAVLKTFGYDAIDKKMGKLLGIDPDDFAMSVGGLIGIGAVLRGAPREGLFARLLSKFTSFTRPSRTSREEQAIAAKKRAKDPGVVKIPPKEMSLGNTIVTEIGSDILVGSAVMKYARGLPYLEPAFTVNGEFSKGTAESGQQVARVVKERFDQMFDRLPSGTLLKNTPYNGDGLGDKRAKVYAYKGFGERDARGDQWGVIKNGKLYPVTPTEMNLLARNGGGEL